MPAPTSGDASQGYQAGPECLTRLLAETGRLKAVTSKLEVALEELRAQYEKLLIQVSRRLEKTYAGVL